MTTEKRIPRDEATCDLCHDAYPVAVGFRYCDPCDEKRRKTLANKAANEARRLATQALNSRQGVASETIHWGGGRMLIQVEMLESIDT